MVQYTESDNRLIKEDKSNSEKDKKTTKKDQFNESILKQYGLSENARILTE